MLTFSKNSPYNPQQQAELALQTLSLADPLRTVHPICEAGTIMGKPWFQTTMGHEFGQSFDVTLWDDLGCNLYAAINGFNSISSRKQANLRCLNDLFFDLDMEDAHRSTATAEEIEQAKEEALELLAETIDLEALPRPTMVVWTGRGLQLHYVLDKSMAYRLRTGAVNREGILVLEKTRAALDERMKAFCAALGHGFASDPAVSDLSRICRLPGSINQAASAIYGRPVRAELLDGEGPLWAINELDAFLGVERPGKSKRENPATERQIRWLESFVGEGKLVAVPENVTIEQADALIKQLRGNVTPTCNHPANGSSDDASIAETRMREISRLQELRAVTGREEGHRHIMAFLFLNSAMLALNPDAALVEARAFNSRFNSPLKDSEITSIHSSLLRRGSSYRFTFQTVCDKLDLNGEEEALLGPARRSNGSCGRNGREVEREQAKEKTAVKKRSRNEQIAALANEGITYQAIADEVGCSRRTVCSVLADAGYRRNEHKTEECSDCPEKGTCPFADRETFKVAIGRLGKTDETEKPQVLEKCKKLSRTLRLFRWCEGYDVAATVDVAAMGESLLTEGFQLAKIGIPWRVQAVVRAVSKVEPSASAGLRPSCDSGGG